MKRSHILTHIALLALLSSACGAPSDAAANSARVVECPEGFREEQCDLYFAINMERTLSGLEPLVFDATLGELAQSHAEDMSKNSFLDHDSSDGATFEERVIASGYPGEVQGQDISSGRWTAEDTMAGWMKSDAYRARILSRDINDIGIGYREAVWVQVVGMSARPTP